MITAITPGKHIDEGRQWLHLTITLDNADYTYNHVAPAGLSPAQLSAYVSARARTYALDILRDIYPGADYSSHQGTDDLDRFQAWIAAGCVNKETKTVNGKTITVDRKIDKTPYRVSHPEWLSIEDDINAISTLEDVKTVLKKLHGKG